MTLAELLKQIESANRPSVTIDWLVEVTVRHEVAVPHHDPRMNAEGYVITAPGTTHDGAQAYRPAMYSGSIDQAVWLIGEKRPNWNWSVGTDRTTDENDDEEPIDRGFNACVWPGWREFPDELAVVGLGKTPGLALVAALVKSLMQGETQ
jgi:hypothetical protein